METAVVVSAIVQAIAAVFVATFTVLLVRWTRDYVRAMREANGLQAEANRLAHASLNLAQGQVAPLMVVQRNGRNSDGGTYVESVSVVQNQGGGPALGVVVETSWGDAPLDRAVLPAGEVDRAKVRIAYGDWERKSDPDLLAVRYVDAQGNEHRDPLPDHGRGAA